MLKSPDLNLVFLTIVKYLKFRMNNRIWLISLNKKLVVCLTSAALDDILY